MRIKRSEEDNQAGQTDHQARPVPPIDLSFVPRVYEFVMYQKKGGWWFLIRSTACCFLGSLFFFSFFLISILSSFSLFPSSLFPSSLFLSHFLFHFFYRFLFTRLHGIWAFRFTHTSHPPFPNPIHRLMIFLSFYASLRGLKAGALPRLFWHILLAVPLELPLFACFAVSLGSSRGNFYLQLKYLCEHWRGIIHYSNLQCIWPSMSVTELS